MKTIFSVLILFLLASVSSVSAQQIRVLKGFKSFSGTVGEWGVQKGGGIYPAKGWVFYDIGQVAVVILPQDKPDPNGLKVFMRRNPQIQTRLFGTTYEEYAKKGKKKKKGSASGIVIRCENDPSCSGTCSAVFGQDCPGCPETFIRCSGNCCKDAYGTHIPEADAGTVQGMEY